MLKGKNAIITGARSGIGFATMQLFAQHGVNCWAIGHREDADCLEQINKLQEKYSIWIKPIFIDLSDSEAIKSGIKEIIKDKQPIDILVNAAGVVSPNRLFTMTSMNDVRKVMEVNFFSILEITQLVARVMQRQKSGSIINVASISAWGEDTAQLEYAASKAALVIATKKLANEFGAYGIRVNAVAPGLTETKMLDGMDAGALDDIKKGMALHRFGKPKEIAEVIKFLVSEESSFVTGTTVRIDGGAFDLRLRYS